MGKNRACKVCRAAGHDSKGDHLFEMSDKSRWTCRRMEYHPTGEPYYEDADGNAYDVGATSGVDDGSTSGDDELLRILAPSSGGSIALPVLTPSGPGAIDVKEVYRGILPETFSKYKTLGTYEHGSLSTLVHELKDLNGKRVVDKIRRLPKDFYTSGKTDGKALQFFGMDIVPKAKRILITEGELDCLSAYQMLAKWKVGVWSLPLGANKKVFLDNIDRITKQTNGKLELFFSMDQDDAGKKLEKELAALFPKAKFLQLDRKDANSYIDPDFDGGKPAPDEFVSAFWEAEIFKPDSIVRVSSCMEDVLRDPVVGMEWPWPTLTKATYGRRGGEGMFVGAGVKAGKSEFLNEVIAFDCKNNRPIAAIKFEEQPAQTIKRIAGKIDGVTYHKPGTVFNKVTLESTALSLEPNLFLHRAFGQANWDTCKQFIRYAAGMGCKTVIIDPITRISNGMSSSDTETELRRFSDELACMAMDLDMFYIVTCHLKAPFTGPLHERGGKVQSAQFRGSRSMAEACFYMLGIERNKDPDLTEVERNTSKFVLLEDRSFGNVCSFEVRYDPVDQSYLEPMTSSSF